VENLIRIKGNKNMKLDKSQISAVILAGGQGTRMGNVNKGLLPLQGRTMIEHVITRLRPQVDSIVISANQDVDAYRALGYDTVRDQIPGAHGPLAGIYSAMTISTREWLACVPCDVPQLPLDLIARLSAADPAITARVAHDGIRQQSLCCLLHMSLRDRLKAFLLGPHQAAYRFLATQHALEVDFADDAAAFTNINTQHELQGFA
jgi:molybdopterin-guanine dinucleotide biosynthesis protein A